MENNKKKWAQEQGGSLFFQKGENFKKKAESQIIPKFCTQNSVQTSKVLRETSTK